jgi:hypothetical protein
VLVGGGAHQHPTPNGHGDNEHGARRLLIEETSINSH